MSTESEASGPDEKSVRLSDTIYQMLLQDIVSGRRMFGSTVSEVVVAKELKVSRTPVHDALRRLIKDGFVRQEANRRAVICEFTSADVIEIFEMRQLLEGEAAYRAATRIDRTTILRLIEQNQLWLNAADEESAFEEWAKVDYQLHSDLAEACGSSRLRDDILRYHRLHRCINTFNESVDGLRSAAEEHLDVLQALKARDAQRAKDAMNSHIYEWKNYFVRRFAR